MSQGAIWLHRQLLDCPELAEPHALALWVHLLLRAQHKPYRAPFRGGTYQLQRGQLVTSMRALENETKVPMQRLRTILQRFAKCGMVRIDTAPNTAASVVTICKYDDFQTLERSTNTASNTASTQFQHTEQEWKNPPTPNVESESNRLPDSAPAKPSPRTRAEYPLEFERIWRTYPIREEDDKAGCCKLWRTAVKDHEASALQASAVEWHQAQRENEFRIGLRRWLKDKRYLTPPPVHRPNPNTSADPWFQVARETYQTQDNGDATDEFGPVLEGARDSESYETAGGGAVLDTFGGRSTPVAGGLHRRVAALPSPSGGGCVWPVGAPEGDLASTGRAGGVHRGQRPFSGAAEPDRYGELLGSMPAAGSA